MSRQNINNIYDKYQTENNLSINYKECQIVTFNIQPLNNLAQWPIIKMAAILIIGNCTRLGPLNGPSLTCWLSNSHQLSRSSNDPHIF